VELTQVQWHAAHGVLSGIGLGTPGSSWTLTIYVPAGFRWHDGQRVTSGVAVTFYGDHLLQARLYFAGTDRVAWSFSFDAVQGADASAGQAPQDGVW